MTPLASTVKTRFVHASPAPVFDVGLRSERLLIVPSFGLSLLPWPDGTRMAKK